MNGKTSQDVTHTLRVTRGGTRFPERPIDTERFLIGAGSNCHLKLGGGIGILHSVVVVRGDVLWIDALISDPPLMVNGKKVRDGELKHGDVIEIGPFQFQLCKKALEPRNEEPVEEMEPESLEDLSAEELVDRLGEELEQLETIAETQDMGFEALLNAIQDFAIVDDDEDLHFEQMAGTFGPTVTLGDELPDADEILIEGSETHLEDDSDDLRKTA